MFFILSKLLIYFIYPLSWFLVCFVAALIVKKPQFKRRLLIISAILLFIFSDPFIFIQFATRWDIKPVPLKKTGSYSCAIVLGGFSGVDGNGNGHFNGTADRFIQALKLLSTGTVSHILISSGNGNLIPGKFKEADWVKTQLNLLKVPDSCVLIENQSRNTLENAAFSKVVLKENHLAPPYLLVTSAFHMRRSLSIFNKENIDVIPYPCNYIVSENKIMPDNFIPDALVLTNWNLYIKEVIGMLVNHFK